jgi:hypothetical protein
LGIDASRLIGSRTATADFHKERFMFSQPQFCSSSSLSPPDIGSRMAEAIEAMRAGRPVILIDDEDRENEADLIVAAEALTVPTMALLIRECSHGRRNFVVRP